LANPVSSVDVPLSIFSGLDTELSAPDLPEGSSPANNDVVFTPGAVATRPGLNRIFAAPIDALGPFSYQKSFVTPSGVIKNLYFTKNDGILWVEDLAVSPGTAISLFQSSGATYASSCTAEGREYIALSDGVHGADVPLTYDGVNLWRTTQDGPANAPVVQSVALPSSALSASSGACLQRNNNTVTANTATAHSMKVGYLAQISNVPDSNSTSVNKVNTSYAPGSQTAYSGWEWNTFGGPGAWRSHFNPGTSPLSGFVATGLGFNVPSNAIVLGVIVGFGVWAQSTTAATVNEVALWQTGAQLGTMKSPATAIGTTPYPPAIYFGTAADQWGGALTPAIVNDPSFGFAVSIASPNVRIFLCPPFTVTVYYTLSSATEVTSISTIVIDNESNPGIATVTTTAPHGLAPQETVNIIGVVGAAVGGGISTVEFSGGLCTITTVSAHNRSVGDQVKVVANTYPAASGLWTVSTVPSPNSFAFAAAPPTPISSGGGGAWGLLKDILIGGSIDPVIGPSVGTGIGLAGFSSTTWTPYGGADTGTVTTVWPLVDSSNGQNYFTVVTCPTPTSFTVQMTYNDGTWTGGTVGFIWEGTYFVTAVPSATQFQYQQYGPDGATSAVGTATPYGQATPGIHQAQVSYLLASGDITAPSPPVTFVANGGQYLQVTMPIGPSNVVGRIVQFTGALGAYFYYIPVPAIINGILVSTATQIDDNTTQIIIMDFADNTLYAAQAVSMPGNNLAAQVVLGPCAGHFTYAGRLIAWGERNKIQNLLNMGFDANAENDLYSQGWTTTGVQASIVSLASRPPGGQLQLALVGYSGPATLLSQPFYRDCYGAPIGQPLQAYKLRYWISVPAHSGLGHWGFTASITSASTGFSSTMTVSTPSGPAYSGYYEVDFPLAMPVTIPSDMLINIAPYYLSGTTIDIVLDELEIIPVDQPYLDTQARISYADNFGGFDAVTGVIGAQDDLSPIRNFGTIRKSLYMVTGTGLHETQDNDQSEPGNWNVDPVADNCGAFSIASVARNPQGIGSAGKDWMMWSGPDGAQIFTGQKPLKISQEIQSVWDAVPAAYAYQAWVKNWENSKWCFFGLPTATGSMQVWVLDYRNIDGAMIAENPPIHISFTGKMIVSDLTRKWTGWNVPALCGELMYRGIIAQPQMVFGGSDDSDAAQSYILNASQRHDDDFGTIPASYTTYFFVSHEMEQALQVGSHRHIYTMAQAFISGTGTWTLTPCAASLNNQFPASPAFPLTDDPFFDVDFGINVNTTRCAFTVQAQPVGESLDSYFKLQKLVVNMAKDPNAPVRGTSGGSF
jgi:hypothetical protein